MKPRVLYITNRYRQYDHLVCETLATAFDLYALWISPPPPGEALPKELAGQMHGYVLHTKEAVLRPFDFVRNVLLIWRTLQLASRVDVVISSTSESWKSKVAFVAARLKGTQVAFRKEKWFDADIKLTGLRGLYWRLQGFLTRCIERNADVMLVGGSKARDYLIRNGVETERIWRFHYLHDDLSTYPVDPEHCKVYCKGAGDPLTLLYLGRIMEQKGLHVLIPAVRKLLADGYNIRLLVVGDPILKDTGRGNVSTDYFEICKQLAGEDKRILFCGGAPAEAVHNYYHCADVFVHPHVDRYNGQVLYEGWGNVITEAASMGLPIVTTDHVPSAFDFVEHGKNGFILDASRLEDQLIEAIRFFEENRDQVRAFGRYSRQHYESQVDPQHNVLAIQQLLG